MQRHVRYLVVEDDAAWSQAIVRAIQTYFADECRFADRAIRGDSAYDGDQAWQRVTSERYDLVALDMNLSTGPGASKISGLDVLSEIVERDRAFFVIIITGAVTDPDLERVYGAEAASQMRVGARNDAARSFPPERILALNKPAAANVADAMEQLGPHLRSALEQYSAASRERNIFRPFPDDPSLWEMRFDGGPRLTIPGYAGFELIRSALAQPDREMHVNDVVRSIVHGRTPAPTEDPPLQSDVPLEDEDPEDAERDEADDDLDMLSIRRYAPSDTIESAFHVEQLIGGLLQARREETPLGPKLDEYREAFGLKPLLRLPKAIASYVARPSDAEEEFGVDSVPDLRAVLTELRPLYVDLVHEAAASPRPGGSDAAQANIPRRTFRVATSVETREMMLARQQWQRARKYLARHKALDALLEHLDTHVIRGADAKGRIEYAPSRLRAAPLFWLTR